MRARRGAIYQPICKLFLLPTLLNWTNTFFFSQLLRFSFSERHFNLIGQAWESSWNIFGIDGLHETVNIIHIIILFQTSLTNNCIGSQMWRCAIDMSTHLVIRCRWSIGACVQRCGIGPFELMLRDDTLGGAKVQMITYTLDQSEIYRMKVNYAAFIPRNDDCISTLVHPDASLKQRLWTPVGIARSQRLLTSVGTARLLLYDATGLTFHLLTAISESQSIYFFL